MVLQRSHHPLVMESLLWGEGDGTLLSWASTEPPPVGDGEGDDGESLIFRDAASTEPPPVGDGERAHGDPVTIACAQLQRSHHPLVMESVQWPCPTDLGQPSFNGATTRW